MASGAGRSTGMGEGGLRFKHRGAENTEECRAKRWAKRVSFLGGVQILVLLKLCLPN